MKSAIDVAGEIKSGLRSVASVVEESIALAKAWNPKINAIIEDNYSSSQAQAEALDKSLSALSNSEREKLPIFFGIPFTCKEMISVQGMKSTLGSVHRKDRVMNNSASAFSRVLDSGAILLGTTNIPEVGFWFECDNVVYGPTKNPFDQKRTSGGSSGGEAAIIASGASYFGLGSDIGGSIRTPAAFCGIFGHKPSENLIPITGHYPFYASNATEFSAQEFPFTVIGPMARTVKDLRALFHCLIGPDGIDPRVVSQKIPRFDTLKIADINFFFLPEPKVHGATNVSSEICESIENVRKYVENLGGKSTAVDSNLFLQAFDMWLARAKTIETEGFGQHLADTEKISYGTEFLKLALGKRSYTFPALMTAFLEEYGQDASSTDYYLTRLEKLRKQLQIMMGSNGVLVMPVHPRVAPTLGSTIQRPFDFSLAGIINALGFPATTVPIAKNSQGLPIGIQVVASQYQDELCLKVAEILEKGFGGSLTP